MAKNLISHFENLNDDDSPTMDKRKPSLTREGSNKYGEKYSRRVKRLITDLTEIRRPNGRGKSSDENSGTCPLRSRTLPRPPKRTEKEFIDEHGTTGRDSGKEQPNGSLSNVATNKLPHTNVDVEEIYARQVEEFAEKLHKKRSQQHQNIGHKGQTSTSKEVQNSERTYLQVVNGGANETENKASDDVLRGPLGDYHSLCEIQDDSDDMFGVNDFFGEDNFVVEAYNREGEWLVISALEITRVAPNAQETKLRDLLHSTDYVFFEHGSKQSHHDEDSNSLDDDYLRSSAAVEKSEDTVFYANRSSHLSANYFQTADNSSDSDKSDEDHKNEDAIPRRTSMRYSRIIRAKEDNEDDSAASDNDEFEAQREIQDCTLSETRFALDEQSASVTVKHKMNYVIEEMIKTEELYISGLRIVVEEYLPHLIRKTPLDLIGKTTYLFGNIEDIYQDAKLFLVALKEASDNVDGIADTFIKSGDAFTRYTQYSKNKPTADIYLKQFEEVTNRKQEILGDKLGLASYLLTPIQRLGKYCLLLESIQKELNKSHKSVEKISAAINVIRKVMRKGNDFIAIDSIKHCKVDFTLQGSFIMRALFNILKPKKFTSMVFLFDNIIIFTEKLTKNVEQFKYVQSIHMCDLSLGKFEEKPNIFHLTDYPKSKRMNHDVSYVLEAETPRIKNDWTRAIEEKLWSQLHIAKEQQKQVTPSGNRLRLTSAPTATTRTNSKKSKDHKRRSKFYANDDNVF